MVHSIHWQSRSWLGVTHSIEQRASFPLLTLLYLVAEWRQLCCRCRKVFDSSSPLESSNLVDTVQSSAAWAKGTGESCVCFLCLPFCAHMYFVTKFNVSTGFPSARPLLGCCAMCNSCNRVRCDLGRCISDPWQVSAWPWRGTVLTCTWQMQVPVFLHVSALTPILS